VVDLSLVFWCSFLGSDEPSADTNLTSNERRYTAFSLIVVIVYCFRFGKLGFTFLDARMLSSFKFSAELSNIDAWSVPTVNVPELS